MLFYQQSIPSLVKEFDTDIAFGLKTNEAEKRLSKYGANSLPAKKKPSLFLQFIGQFKDLLVIILLIATLISLALGEMLDAVAIFTIVLLNAVIGFVQEVKARQTLLSLQEKEILYATVIRNGQIEKISANILVPGDILILEEGVKIPADCRIVDSYSLQVDESILTGESQGANKNSKIIPKDVSLADRENMLYKDTKILAGRGKAIVVTTGINTEIGSIAKYLEKIETPKTPLTVELEKVGKMLTVIVGIIALIIFIINYFSSVPFIESLLISISLSVAAIPEGLPAIVTIVLSIGVKRLAQKKTLVKKLASVETLGAVRVIATDKTGTLTQNKINVVKIMLPNYQEFSVQGQGYLPNGTFFDQGQKVTDPQKIPSLEILLRAAVLASNAVVKNEDGRVDVIGDTTEAALVVAAQRAKLIIEDIHASEPRLFEIPFSASRKMMSVLVKVNDTGDHLLYTKGAPEVILDKCILTQKEKDKILLKTIIMAQKGLRSLAIAQKKLTKEEVANALEKDKLGENDFIFLGLACMQDPLRSEVIEAIKLARKAGIETIMITGDHEATAKAIAIEAGIIGQNDITANQQDIDKLSVRQLSLLIKKGVKVFARITPMGKNKIVEAIKSLPNTYVAVTGDGVNDAPALSSAQIGIAMGQTGTDLAREVAGIVIMDDNYATIIDAIREGRVIFANLVKFVRYLISCNVSEVVVIALAVLLGVPIPLFPIQILWVNLITDGAPALALGLDAPEYDVMSKPPRDLTHGILHKKRWIYMLIEGLVIGASVFGLFLYAIPSYSLEIAQTMAFCTLSFAQLIHAFNHHNAHKSIFTTGVFNNHYLVYAVIFSIVGQVFVTQTIWGNLVFKTVRLDLNQWLIIILVSFIPLVISEIKKFLRSSHLLP